MFFALGLAGRPGVIRVYIPVITLLLLAPLLLQQFQRDVDITRSRWQRALPLALIFTTLWSTYAVVSESRTLGLRYDKVRNALKNFPTEPVVVWGGSFPFEAVYSVLSVEPEARAYQLYGLGVMTWAPYSHAAVEHHAGRGLVERIVSPDGIPFVANKGAINLLEQYCGEHRDGVLQETKRKRFGRLVVSWRRCAPSPTHAK